MAEVLGSAILELSTDSTKLNKGITDAETSTNRGLGNLSRLAIGVGAVGVTAAVGFGAAMLKTGSEVEAAFAEVRTLLPTIGDEAFGALQQDVLDLGKEMNVATDESIPALYQAISAGVPEENVVDFLKIASEAAVGGVSDLETAVDGITSVTNAYGTEVLSAQEASDLMFTAVRLGKTDFTQLSNKISNITPIASSLGVGFDEVAAAMATMTAQGVTTSESTTQLRQLFTEASKTGTELSDTIQGKLGKTFGELVAEGKPVHEILGEVRDSMPDQAFRDLFSSVEATSAALLITGPNAETMNTNLAEMQTSAGATEAAFETMAATTQFKVQRALNWVKTSVSDLGSDLLPVLVAFVEEKLIPAFQSFSDWFTDNKENLTGIWASIQDAAQGFVDWVNTNIVPVVVAAFNAISEWVTNNKDGITGFFDAVKTAATTLVDYFSTSWDLIKTVLQTLFDLIGTQGAGGSVDTFFTNLVSWATTAVDWYSQYLSGITDAIQGITDWINENPETIQAWFEKAQAAVKIAVDAISTVVGGIVTAVQAIVTWVQENPDTIQAWFETAKAVLGTTIAAISTVIGGIVTAVQAIVDWVNENPETIQAWFNTAKAVVETTVNTIITIIGGIVTAVQAIKTWVDENQEGITAFFDAVKTAASVLVDFFSVSFGLISTVLQQLFDLIAPESVDTGSIGTFFTNIVAWATVAVTWFGENLSKITDSIAGITAFLKENPTAIQDWFNNAWAVVDGIITSFKTGIGALVETYGTITTWLTTNATVIQDWFNNAWETVSTVKADMIQAVTDVTEKWATIEEFFSTLWTNVGNTFNNTWALIRDFVIQPFVDAVGWATENWTPIEQWFVDMWNNVGTAFSDAWKGITDLLFPEPSYATQLAQVWGGIVDAIRSIFTDSANSAISILNQLVDLMNTALKKWNDLSFKIEGFSASVPWPSLKNPGRKKEIGWGGINISTPNIPLVATLPPFATAATGGIVDVPTFMLAGEGGEPEAIVPLSRANEFGFGGSGQTTNLYVDTLYGWTNLEEVLAEAGVNVQIGGARNSFAGI